MSQRPTRDRIRKQFVTALVALVTTGLALLGIQLFGGTEEKDKQVVETLCELGLEPMAAYGGLEGFCSHGPDPVGAFAEAIRTESVRPIGPQGLCKSGGDPVDWRVHVYLAYEQGRAIDLPAERARVLKAMGEAERMLRNSHDRWWQGYRWLCEDGVPVITEVAVPAPFDNVNDPKDELDRLHGRYPDGNFGTPPKQAAVYMIPHRATGYCGFGSVYDDTSPAPGNPGAHPGIGGRTSTIVEYPCIAGSVLMHELGHNIGACQAGAPHCPGTAHGYQDNDVMSYNDGTAYWGSGGTLQVDCPRRPSWLFDCGKDDYYDPARPTTGYLAEHWNTSYSPYLSPPRLRT